MNTQLSPTHSGHIAYDANLARLDDLHRRASRRVAVEKVSEPVAIRRAAAEDRGTIERLAALDSAAVPSGEVLIAEVSGEARAAIEITGGATVADPFRPTRDLVDILSSRARLLRRETKAPRRLRLHLRTA